MKPPTQLLNRSDELARSPEGDALQRHPAAGELPELPALVDLPGRYADCHREAAGLLLDYSRQRVTAETLQLLTALAEARGVRRWAELLLDGADVNNTEERPALHTALRSIPGDVAHVGGVDVVPAVLAERARMLELAEEIRAGNFRGHTGQPIRDVVNLGIGGSDLGAVMATEALGEWRHREVHVHFVSNIDGTQLADVLAGADPERTLFIVCSKSFTTQETRLNAEAARAWLLRRLPAAALGRHFVAVSVNSRAMDEFGVDEALRFPIWDWVGGRYSLWSSVGLAIAIAVGAEAFGSLLAGARTMDRHFREAPFADNLPVLLGLLGVWNQNHLGTASHVVLPYDGRLHRLPAFLQQLDMESNGKGVTRSGQPVAYGTGTIIWGEPGSNAQHSFYQLLHQGPVRFSADFIAPAQGSSRFAEQHLAGLANMLAQAEAFARGYSADAAHAELVAAGKSPEEASRLAPHKQHPGGHAASVILMPKLEPATLGALVALYEHKVFVQSVVWGINPFDQWGVELGKRMAARMQVALASGKPEPGTPGIAEQILRWREPG